MTHSPKPESLQSKWDRLWPAATRVNAIAERVRLPVVARPTPGEYPEVDRLIEACEELSRVVNEISPDEEDRP